jgi:MFS transporter, DHA1 family, tetracycline resistance protein
MSDGSHKPALGFIFVTLVLIVLGFGILIPVLPGLVEQFEHGSVVAGSRSYGWLLEVFAIMQFFAAPVLGALSDQFGRRRVLLIALAGASIDYVIMGLAPTIGWLFVGRVISGLTAGALATVNAYVADVTPPEKRAHAFGIMGAAFGLGFVIGPVVGGALGHFGVKWLGPAGLRLPFFVAAGCVALNWLYGALVLPESLPKENRRKFSWRRANPVGSLLVLRSLPSVFNLAGTYFLYWLAFVMMQSVWVLYMGYRYSWNTWQVSESLGVAGLLSVVVQGGLARPVLARVGERRGLVLGLGIIALSYVGYGLSSHGWMIYGVMCGAAIGGVSGPALQSLITRHVPADQQGAVQGTLSGLSSVAGVISPLVATWSFAACIAPTAKLPWPGIAFFEGAALIAAGVWLAVRTFRADDRLAAANAGARG